MVNWDEMEYDERNHWIADHVMGWKCDDRHCDGTWIVRCGSCGRSGHGNCYGDGSGAVQVRCNHCPDYVGDLSAAWQVVEHIQADDKACVFGVSNHVNRKWWATFNMSGGVFRAFEETAPLAICHAAYLATRHQQMRELADEAADENAEAMRRLAEGD